MERDQSRMRFVTVLGFAIAVIRVQGITPDLGVDQQHPYVGECGGGSGTAISPRSMITARHVPGLTFEVMGKIYTAVERINHPNYDLAIFNFASDLPVWCPLGASAPIGTPVTWVGYGGIGYVNQAKNGYDIRYGNFGRHAATNIVHKKWSMFNLGPALVSMLDDNPDSAGVNGDSGGACLANGRLVGVISYAFNLRGGQLPNYGFAILNNGIPYHGSGAIDLTIPEIHQWVRANMNPGLFTLDPAFMPYAAPKAHTTDKQLELPLFESWSLLNPNSRATVR
ncbi:MAG: hypothetical protein HONBIEJF_01857 [Fimbriimonadaceae bacterium]|nr:hypothetical protein [Fimbriimonadaceae bacterium]